MMSRVLVIEPAGELWGSERALLDMIGGLPAGRVAAVCCPGGSPLQPVLEKKGVPVAPYLAPNLHKGPRWRRLIASLGVLRACLKFRPDILYLNQSGIYRTVLPVAMLLGKPLIAHIRLFEEIDYLAAQRDPARHLAGLIVTSDAVKAEVERRPALAAIPVHRVYDAYAAVSGRKHETRDENSPRRIVCAGRIAPMKGQALLLDALSQLDTGNTPEECVFAGTGDTAYVEELKAKAATIENVSVKWLGFVEDVTGLLQSTQVLAFPSSRETLGRVVFEAWEAGAVPVVFAGSGGAAEIVQAAKGGCVYAEQTPQALAAALHTALTLGEEQRAQLISSGRDWLAANCDPSRCAKAMDAIFESVVR